MKLIKILVFTTLLLAPIFLPVQAQTQNTQEFSIGKVEEIQSEKEIETYGEKQQIQMVKLKIIYGPEKNKEIIIEHGKTFSINENQKAKLNEYVIVVKTDDEYFITDKLRLGYLISIFLAFFVLVLIFSNLRGIGSFIGLGVSILILVTFIVPQIVNGQNPLLISLVGVAMISILSMYLAHGINIRTTLSLISMLLVIALTGIMASAFVVFSKLFGTGSEEAYFVQIGFSGKINLQGLLLAGIVLGASGVLDDITTAQTAVVDELKMANKSLNMWQLYKKGISVGQEHISSLVNTLVLAYAGASMPLFMLFTIVKDKPLWIILNSENIAEEIVRTLVGSIALVVAVPLSTFLAAAYFSKYQSHEPEDIYHHHHHGHSLV